MLLLAGCVTPPAPRPAPEVPAPVVPVVVDAQAPLKAVVAQFIAASEARQFDQVHALLSKPLRERYSPDQLARDYDAEPLAVERVAAIKKASARFTESKDQARATLEWAAGRTLRLVREDEGWRIATVE